MSLFQNRPQASDTLQYYTLGQHKTVLIVGLGNVGQQYDHTRHNIGFACIDAFATANQFDPWVEKKDWKGLYTSKTLSDTRVILLKPTTLMNLSGESVQAVASFYKVGPQHIVAVHDELDIPFGSIRTRMGGSSAGHNGLQSLIQHIGEGFGRVRIGIGPKQPEQMDSADFVLARFSADQQTHIKNLTQETSAILSEYVFGGELPHETRSFI